MYYLRLPSFYNGRAELLWQMTYGLQKWKCLPSGLLQKRFSTSWEEIGYIAPSSFRNPEGRAKVADWVACQDCRSESWWRVIIPCLLPKFIPFPSTSSSLNLKTEQVPVYNLICIEWISWKPCSSPFSISQLSTPSLLTLPGFSVSLRFASSSSPLLIPFRLAQLAEQGCFDPLHSFWITAHADFVPNKQPSYRVWNMPDVSRRNSSNEHSTDGRDV